MVAVERTSRKFDPHRAVSGLALEHQIVPGPAVVFGIALRFSRRERSRRRCDGDLRRLDRRRHGKSFCRSLGDFAFLRNQAAEFFYPFCAQDEFQSRQEFVLAVPRFREDPQNGLDGGEQLFFRQKIAEHRGRRGQASQSAADENLKAAMRGTVAAAHLRDKAHVMDAGNRAIAIVLAARESDLELARQVVKIGMSQEVS